MRRLIKFILVLFMCTSVYAADVITIGMLPGGNPLVIEKESLVLAQKLQQKIGQPVQVYISKNYTGMIEALKNKKVDFAVLSAMTYVYG